MPSTTRSDDPTRRRVAVITRPDTAETAAFRAACAAAGIRVDVHETTAPAEVRAAVGEALSVPVDAIAVVGGDGSLNLVVGDVV